MKNKLNIIKTITIILPTALLLASCSSNRLPFIITAQYADRPILIGQYKRPGEKIDPAAKGIPFESKQGTDDLGNQSNSSSCCLSLSNQNNDTGMNLNKLSRDILMTNCKKSDIIVVQEINIGSSTYQIFSVGITLTNKSILKGKILEGSAK